MAFVSASLSCFKPHFGQCGLVVQQAQRLQAMLAEEYGLNKRITILLLNKVENAFFQIPVLLKASLR